MPRLNAFAVPTEGRQVHWYDDRTIFQKCTDRCRIVLSDDTIIADRGAGSLVGNNRKWAAWLDGYGVYDSYGNLFEKSSIAETRMSEDGWYVRKVLYQGSGPWILQKSIRTVAIGGIPDFGYVYVLPAIPGFTLDTDSPRAVWVENGVVKSFGVTLTDPGRKMWWPVPIETDREIILLYQDQATGQLILGDRVIAPKGDYFYPDAKFLDGRFVVTWSPNSGDVRNVRKSYTPDDLLYYPRIGEEKPMARDRFWLGPCIGSADMTQMFDDPAALSNVYAHAMVTENILNLGTDIGPNTFEALQANHAFQKLKQAGVKQAIEGGPNLGDLEAVDKIRGVKGDVAFFSVSEPLADLYLHPAPGKTLDTVVAKVVEFTHAAEAKGLAVGWLEGWPSVKVEQYRPYLEKLKAQGVRPAYLHLDIDRRHAQQLGLSMFAAIKTLHAIVDEYGVPFGVLLWGYDNKDEVSYKEDVKKFAADAYAALPSMQHVCVQSWAIRTTNHKRELPNNLGTDGLLETFDVVSALFSQTAPIPAPDPGTDPEPGPDPTPTPEEMSMFAALIDPLKEVLAVKEVKAVSGLSTLILADFVENGVVLKDKVFSQQPNGSAGWREPGTAGVWEKCIVSGSQATFRVDWTDANGYHQKYFVRFFTKVSGL